MEGCGFVPPAVKVGSYDQKGAVPLPVHPRVKFSSLVSVLRRNATDPKENQRAQLHLDQGKIKEWADVAPVDSNTKAW